MSNIVLVTGADGGIGLEICKKFKLNNWIVIGTSLIKGTVPLIFFSSIA